MNTTRRAFIAGGAAAVGAGSLWAGVASAFAGQGVGMSGRPPEDAVILFDGTQKSLDENWTDARGRKSRWRFVDGAMEAVRSAGNICSREKFGAVQLHVEWMVTAKAPGVAIGCGNSGVFLFDGMYEVQVYDSYEPDGADKGNNHIYADGQAGSIYGQNPPLVNPVRKPGEWQSYDIVFHPPVFEGGKCVQPGSITAFMNGVLVQDHWELEGPMFHVCRTRQVKPRAAKGSIQFQDHGDPVRFRNVWARHLTTRTRKRK